MDLIWRVKESYSERAFLSCWLCREKSPIRARPLNIVENVRVVGL